jgi:hypothetical protein
MAAYSVTEYAGGVRTLTKRQCTVITITALTGRLITVMSTSHQYSIILTKSPFLAYRLITCNTINSKENKRISSSDRVCVRACVSVSVHVCMCVYTTETVDVGSLPSTSGRDVI